MKKNPQSRSDMAAQAASRSIEGLAAKISRGEVVFFLGAGASHDAPASLALAQTIVRSIAERVLLPAPGESLDQTVGRVADRVRLEVFIQAITTAIGVAAIDALPTFLTGGAPNGNHRFIARLASESLAPIVLTTNFDCLLERALLDRNLGYRVWCRDKHYSAARLDPSAFTVIKLHGSLHDAGGGQAHDSILIAADQVGKIISRQKGRTLKQVLQQYDVVFAGYSGLDDFDLLPFILTTKSNREIFWLRHSDETRMSCTPSAVLRRRSATEVLDNPERIVASRENGVLLEGPTAKVIAMLERELFNNRENETAAPENSIHAGGNLDDWTNRWNVAQYRALITGLLLERLERHSDALQVYGGVRPASAGWETARYQAAVCMRRTNDISKAKDTLVGLLRTPTISHQLKVKARVELGRLHIERSNDSAGVRCLKGALRAAPKDRSVQATANNDLGIVYLVKAERLYLTGGPRGVIRARAKQAATHLRAARRAVDRDGDPQKLANIRGNLGLAYVFIGQLHLAEKECFEALRLFQCLGVSSAEASCLSNIGYLYKEKALRQSNRTRRQSLLEEAIRYSQRAYSMKMSVSTPRRLGFSQFNLGLLFALTGDREEALGWLAASLATFEADHLAGYASLVTNAINSMSSDPRDIM